MKRLWPILILLANVATAQETPKERERELLLSVPNPEDITAKELNNFPEIYLQRDTILEDRDSDSGIYEDPHYSLTDDSRFAVGLGFSQDYNNPTKVQSLYGSYMNRINDFYQEMWWALHFKRTQAHFNAISDDPETGGRGTNNQSFTIMGMGVAHNFYALADLVESNRIFETIAVYLNYNFHRDSTDEENYQGFGYTADYSLAYRTSKRFFIGGKFSYNWAQVARAAENDEEKLPARSLVFGWTTMSFELGYYF